MSPQFLYVGKSLEDMGTGVSHAIVLACRNTHGTQESFCSQSLLHIDEEDKEASERRCLNTPWCGVSMPDWLLAHNLKRPKDELVTLERFYSCTCAHSLTPDKGQAGTA